ncbi:hypothetical protein SLEP1_g56267 [Rubroshorea leprosula]|uniref:Uncharacterized protein n=1 Tax=Rubroshorea leprosula TaxID=152421 RepID=A0AAV5MKY9_9ROSI|nr:hypothetical protein SLEP1_g56267 [Rubroshorea leprosula]
MSISRMCKENPAIVHWHKNALLYRIEETFMQRSELSFGLQTREDYQALLYIKK